MAQDEEELELTLHLHHETDLAFLVSEDGDRKSAVCLPKSQMEQGRALSPDVFEFSVPEWLASKNGLT